MKNLILFAMSILVSVNCFAVMKPTFACWTGEVTYKLSIDSDDASKGEVQKIKESKFPALQATVYNDGQLTTFGFNDENGGQILKLSNDMLTSKKPDIGWLGLVYGQIVGCQEYHSLKAGL